MTTVEGKLKDKIVLITGGASGIGKASVVACCKEDAKVIFLDLDESGGKRLEEELLSQGKSCKFLQSDVTSSKDWQKVVDYVKKTHGKLDVLYNNAGTNVIKPTVSLLEEEWDKVLGVNLKSVFLGIKYMRPLMPGRSSIISTASSFGLMGRKNMAAYCASKGAVISLTRELSLEYATENVRVNCISPGPTLTELLKGNIEKGLTDRNLLLSSVPMDRFADPSEIAALVVYLASDDSSFVTGANLVIDGGQTVG